MTKKQMQYIESSVKKSLLKTKKIDDFTIIELDKEGNILGIEILEASKRVPKKSLSEVRVKNIAVNPKA